MDDEAIIAALLVNTGNENESVTDVYRPEGWPIVVKSKLAAAGYTVVRTDAIPSAEEVDDAIECVSFTARNAREGIGNDLMEAPSVRRQRLINLAARLSALREALG